MSTHGETGPGRFFAERLHKVPVLAILRGLSPEDAVARAEACWNAGVRVVEVSLSDAAGLPALEALSARDRPAGTAVGAGTIIHERRAVEALNAGATFLVSPGIDEKVSAAARQHSIPLLPGVATPTDIQNALSLGWDFVKMFPASLLGVAWLDAMKAPFPETSFVATGGITPDNAQDFLSHGAAAVAMGSALDPTRVGHLRLHRSLSS